MSGSIAAPTTGPGSQAGTAGTDQQNLQTLTDTYAQAQAFEAQVTQIKVAGDSALDAVKQRPQI